MSHRYGCARKEKTRQKEPSGPGGVEEMPQLGGILFLEEGKKRGSTRLAMGLASQIARASLCAAKRHRASSA